MKKIGIVVNLKKANAFELMQKLRVWLEKRDVVVADTTTSTMDEVLRESELVICLGGDGTILSVAAHMNRFSVPILGVNLGSLGFLTEIKQEEMFEELNAYFLDAARIEERVMLSCSVRSDAANVPPGQKKERRLVALNDMVISREGLSRIIQVEVRVGGEMLTRFAGDGVIIATPTGSTAYSLSAGGSIVHPKLQAIMITPICPHSSALRSMIVDAGEKISVKIKTAQENGKAVLTADGQENFEIDDSYSVEVIKASVPFKLLKSSKRSYFATLRENFKFPI